MLRRTLLIAAASIALTMPAHAETRTYELDGFNKLSVSTGVTVVFEAGETQSIVAENDKGNFDKLILKNTGDTLVISSKASGLFGWGKRPNYTVRISAPAVSALSVSSGSQVTAAGITGEQVSLKVSSGASLEAMNIQAGSISVSASSGADLDAYGSCTSASLSTSSGSSLGANELVCNSVNASASSGASLTAHAKDRVTGSASSGASIKVVGGAAEVDVSKSSGGSVSVS